ncbi:MAG: hypothetical protein QXF52_07510 [Thermoproteota archaeon]
MRGLKNLAIGAIILSLTMVSILCFTLPSSLLFNEQVPSKVDLKDLAVWYIGDSNDVLEKVLNRMQQLGVKQTKRLEIQSFLSNNTLESTSLNQKSLVIFDGHWISERVNDSEIHAFLRKASHQKARLMTVGGSTSKFFEALDKAGVDELGRDENGNIRNPAYHDPPLVGFMLKQARAPDGHSYSYPSIFISSSIDIDATVQELINWLGGG